MSGRKESSRRARHILLTVLAIAVALGLSWGAGQLSPGLTTFDVSEKRLMTPSSEAAAAVRALEEPVTIYRLASAGNEDLFLDELLTRLSLLSGHLTVKRVDTMADAAFAARYTAEALADNSIIVESAARHAVLANEALYRYEYGYNSDYTGYVISSATFVADSALITAIEYVAAEELPKVYALSAQGAALPDGEALREIVGRGLEVVALAETGAVPADARAVLVNAPAADITAAQAKALLEYLKAGGSVLLLTDCTKGTMPNLTSVTSYYGMNAQMGLVLEARSGYYYAASGNAYTQYLLPDVAEHAITDRSLAAGAAIAMPLSHGIVLNASLRDSLALGALCTTSDAAFLKENVNALTTLEREEGDLSGPFVLAAAASEQVAGGVSRLVWFASAQFLADGSGMGNIALFGDTLDWASGSAAPEMSGKSLMGQSLAITQPVGTIWLGAFCALPALLLIAALVTWRRWRQSVV